MGQTTAADDWDSFFARRVQEIADRGERRGLRLITGPLGPQMRVSTSIAPTSSPDPSSTGHGESRVVQMLASSDVLCMGHDIHVRTAAYRDGIEGHGLAAGGSRLICGHTQLHGDLERALASWMGRPSALAFSTGYMANLALVPALVARSPDRVEIYSDSAAHASLIDACRLARASIPIKVLPHNDPSALDRLLQHQQHQQHQQQQENPAEKGRTESGVFRILLLEGVYSMDGDICALREFMEVAKKWSMFVVLDDTHGIGVLGETGRGVEELFHLPQDLRPHVIVGNLGKALGSFGAFVAGSDAFIEYLINTARPFIFTCALPPASVAAALAAVRLLDTEPYVQRRQNLLARALQLRTGLTTLGFDTGDSATHIVPVIIGDNHRTMHMTSLLLDRGIFAQGIRYPSVPKGTARIRLVPTALHTEADIDFVLRVFGDLKRSYLDAHPKLSSAPATTDNDLSHDASSSVHVSKGPNSYNSNENQAVLTPLHLHTSP